MSSEVGDTNAKFLTRLGWTLGVLIVAAAIGAKATGLI